LNFDRGSWDDEQQQKPENFSVSAEKVRDSNVIPEKVRQDSLVNETGFQCNSGKSLGTIKPDADGGLFC
jgi:hypothetical protein